MAKKLYSNLDFQGMELLNVAEYTKEEILAMIGLSDREIDTLQSIIDDSQITTVKTQSSSKIYTDNQEILKQAKEYADKQISKVNRKYKKVDDISKITSQDYIYLLQNGAICERYIVLENGTPFKLDDMSLDLSNVYTKEESDDEFLRKDEIEGTYSTIDITDDIKLKMGNTVNLITDEKGSLVDAINELREDLDVMASSLADAMNSLGSLVGGGA